jgi:hypothetical protein
MPVTCRYMVGNSRSSGFLLVKLRNADFLYHHSANENVWRTIEKYGVSWSLKLYGYIPKCIHYIHAKKDANTLEAYKENRWTVCPPFLHKYQAF